MKKKCLLMLPRNLFPTIGGYAVKTANLVRALCDQYDTQVVVVSERKISAEEKEFYDTHTKGYYYYHTSRWWFVLNTILGLFNTKKPLQCSYYSFRSVKKRVREMSQGVDVVVATIIRMVPYLDYVDPNALKVIDMVDSIGLNYARSAENTVSKFWKKIYQIESKRLLKYEEESVRKANLTWYVNSDEARHWSQIGDTLWTPMAIKEFIFEYDRKDPKYRDSVAFFGKMDYQPNVDAVVWYYKNVHTQLTDPLTLLIIGAYPTSEIKKIAESDPSVIVVGFVDDPYLILNSVLAIIAPMQTGGGMQNKVIETMALGKVNVLSNLAASPIKGANDGQHYMIAENADDYRRCFERLRSDQEFADTIGRNARDLLFPQYRYEKYRQLITESIDKLL